MIAMACLGLYRDFEDNLSLKQAIIDRMTEDERAAYLSSRRYLYTLGRDNPHNLE